MTHSRRLQIERFGFLEETFALANPEIVPEVLGETRHFDDALAAYARDGWKRVPYIVTDPIAAIARDRNIGAVVGEVLGTDSWVMWGSNIRRDVPNQAYRWHTDLESLHWPSLTVAIGLQGCRPEGATWFLPGSQRLRAGPSAAVGGGDLEGVLRAARTTGHAIGEPRQASGFADGRCILFNARCWHRSDPHPMKGRVMLFLHYQRADAKRIPTMLDYDRCLWSREAAPYIASVGAVSIETRVERPPWRHLLRALRRRVRGER